MSRLPRRTVLASVAGLAGCTGGPPESPGAGSPSSTTADVEPIPPDDDAVAWAVRFDRSVTRPTVAGDAVYVGAGRPNVDSTGGEDGDLASLALADGTPRWTASLSAPVAGAPTVRDGVVYAVGGHSTGYVGKDQRLNAVVDGERRWRSDPVDWFLTLLAVGGDRAYLGTADDVITTGGQDLLAVDLADGTTAWTRTSGDAFGGHLVDGSLLVDVGGVAVEVRAPADGARSWQREVELLEGGDGTVPVADGAVFAAANDGDGDRFVALDLADGSHRWSFAGAGERPYVHTGATVGEGVVVGTEYGGAVFALDAADGTERWRFDADGDTREPPLLDGGAVVVGDTAGTVYSLAAADGTERWRADLEAPVGWVGADGDTVVAVTYAEDRRALVGLSATDGTRQWRYASGEGLTRPTLAGGRALVGSEAGVVRALGTQ